MAGATPKPGAGRGVSAGQAAVGVLATVLVATGPLRFSPKPWNARSFDAAITGQVVQNVGSTRGLVSAAATAAGSQRALIRADLRSSGARRRDLVPARVPAERPCSAPGASRRCSRSGSTRAAGRLTERAVPFTPRGGSGRAIDCRARLAVRGTPSAGAAVKPRGQILQCHISVTISCQSVHRPARKVTLLTHAGKRLRDAVRHCKI